MASKYHVIFFNCPEYPQCAATGFQSKFEVKTHCLVSHGQNALPCRVAQCGHSFSTAQQLTDHLTIHHGPTSDTKYDCYKCGRIMPTHGTLANHFELHHQTGHFLCLECGIVLTTRSKVYEHRQEVHSRKCCLPCKNRVTHEKTELCQAVTCRFNKCNRWYANQEELKKHKQVHLNEKLIVCTWDKDVCTYFTHDANIMNYHIRRTHFNELFPNVSLSIEQVKLFYDLNRARIDECDRVAGITPLHVFLDNQEELAQERAKVFQIAQMLETANANERQALEAQPRVLETQSHAIEMHFPGPVLPLMPEASAFQAQEIQAVQSAYIQWFQANEQAQAAQRAQAHARHVAQYFEAVYGFGHAGQRFHPY